MPTLAASGDVSMSPATASLRSALMAPRPYDQLVATAARLVEEGRPRQAVIGELHELIVALQVEGNVAASPTILGVIDRLGGWCTPEMRI